MRPAVTCKVTAESAPPFLVAGVQRQTPLLSDRAENSPSVSSNSHQAAFECLAAVCVQQVLCRVGCCTHRRKPPAMQCTGPSY